MDICFVNAVGRGSPAAMDGAAQGNIESRGSPILGNK